MIQRWLKGVLAGIATMMFAVMAYNFFIDPFGVLRREASIYAFQNIAVNKIDYLKSNPDRFQGLVLGSSQLSMFNLENIAQTYYYNLALPQILPGWYLSHIQYINENINPIHHVFIGIDVGTVFTDGDESENANSTKPHPDISRSSRFRFFLPYLLRLPKASDIRHSRWGREAPEHVVENIMLDQKGDLQCPLCVETLDEKPEKHLSNLHSKDSYFSRLFSSHPNYSNDEFLREIGQLIAYLKRSGIEYTLFITPLYVEHYAYLDFARAIQFKQGLAQLTNYVDFQDINAITSDRYMFQDAIHPSHKLTDMMREVLVDYYLHGARAIENSQFAYAVDKNNFPEHSNIQIRKHAQWEAQRTHAQ